MAILAAVVAILLAVVLFAQYRVNRAYPGLGWWSAGQAAVAAGFVLSALRGDSLLGRLAVPAYQALLVLGTALIYVGVARFLGRRVRRGWLVALLLALVAWSTYHTFVDDNAKLRSIGLYLTLGVLMLLTAVTLWRHRLASVRWTAGALGLVFLAAALSYLTLAYLESRRAPVANPLYTPSLVNAGAFLTGFTSMLLWTFGLIVMINQRLSADVALEARNMHSVFTTGPDCAIISRLADGWIDDVNEGFTRLTGYPRSEAIGRTSVDLGLWADPVLRDAFIRTVVAEGAVADFPMLVRRQDGTTVDCVLAATTLTLEDQPYLITVARDVTQQRRLEAELLHEATTDGLTGLANRRHFLALCERELRRSGRSGNSLAVAVIDMDHFKDINDAYGHAAGDAAIIAFADAVTSRIRDIDTLGRLGGDEFGLLLPDAEIASAAAALERVRTALAAAPLRVADHEVAMSFSAGVTVHGQDGDSVDAMLARADGALYAAKEQGRDRVVTVEGP
jgi:diguanylate cyclase (GGDEF)-like protein/PAS domain S-box-containing protein